MAAIGTGKKIKLIFEWDGKTVHKEAIGWKGKTCTSETSWLDKALGSVTNQVLKQDYHEEDKGKQKILGIKVG
jgi:hypothetical protein